MTKWIEWPFIIWLQDLCTDLRRAVKIFHAMRQVKKGHLYNPEIARLTREQHKIVWELVKAGSRLTLEIGLFIALIIHLVRGN